VLHRRLEEEHRQALDDRRQFQKLVEDKTRAEMQAAQSSKQFASTMLGLIGFATGGPAGAAAGLAFGQLG